MPFQSKAQRGFMYSNHPKLAKEFEEETPKDKKLPEHVEKMADGGIFNPYDVDQGDTMTARGIPSAPPMPVLPPVPTPAPPPIPFKPQGGLPPPPPQPQIAPPPPPQSSDQNDLSAFLAQQKAGLNKYGPDQQMAVEQDILKRRRGFGQTAGNAMTGLADALMQGVARAGPSNFQSNLNARNDKTEEGMRSAMKDANAGTIAKMKAEMEISQNDPTSPLSKLAQRSASPLLKQLGLTDAEIKDMPASLIADAQTKRLSLEEIRAKSEETKALREQTSKYQQGMLENTRRAQTFTEKNAGVNRQANAAEKLAGRGLGSTIAGMIPGTASHNATNVLEKEAAGEPDFAPDVLSYSKSHGITPQQAQAIKDQRTGGK